MSEVYLGLGSNLGDPEANVRGAAAQLSSSPGIWGVELSPLYRTAPVGVTDQDWFVNAVVRARTSLAARALLERCLEIERSFKRERSLRWGPRTLDIDILIYGQLEISEEGLVVPHPRMLERAFALAPLTDLAPELRVKGRPVRAWLKELGTEGVERLP